MKSRLILAIAVALLATQTSYASLTGNPAVDGWAPQGHSLAEGVYVRGSANYGFDTYTSTFIVDAAIQAAAGGGWNVGDTVIGVGGVFNSTTSGWTVTGAAVNSALSNATGPKIQVKFGTDASVAIPWSASTIAPDAGNGVGSLANGGDGSIQIRSSAYNTAADWAANDDALNTPSSSHITRQGGSTPAADVARLIWNIDGGTGELSSWQILLNISLLGSLDPAPSPGSLAIMTVQNGDNAYTDALVEIPGGGGVVPEPGTMAVWAMLALAGGAGWWKKTQA
jgi:hypothetical protein